MIQLLRKVVGRKGRIVATCSRLKIDFVKILGADEVIDYTSVSVPDFLSREYASRPFDFIFDTVGNDHEVYSKSPAYLTPKGTYNMLGAIELGKTKWGAAYRVLQMIGAYLLPSYLGGVPRVFVFESTKGVDKEGRPRLPKILPYIRDGTFKAIIDSTYTFPNIFDSTRGPEWTHHWCSGCHANGTAR
eukprot:TRINITY_DN14407_c0_g1_i1.p1 TRINITY_DN14407_c0_g1~~TRINITY_DN14407_c0_g1_i1.p1  ORF type:complete len:188 (-),score=14.11 TRINITY_DN14407_c0_g1_i1:34-597(-)